MFVTRLSREAIKWIGENPSHVVEAKREAMMCKLEEADSHMRRTGLCESWFGVADVTTRNVSGGCNGPLLEQLLQGSGYKDAACVELLREGRPWLIGVRVRLPVCA